MALVSGGGVDVVVANDESTSAGSGLKLALYNADKATLVLPTLPTLGSTAIPWSAAQPVSASDVTTAQNARLALLREAARRANAYGAAMYSEFTATMVARVGAAVAGIQKTPNPNNPATLTAASGADVDLPIH